MQIVIAGGGPAGSTCARTLAKAGIRSVLIEASPDGEKSCAGGIPSMLLERYPLPDLLIKQRATGVLFVAPSGLQVAADFPDNLFIGTLRRQEFDRHLRWAAEDAGAHLVHGRVVGYEEKGPNLLVRYRDPDGNIHTTVADFLIGADGASSRIAHQVTGNHLPVVLGIQEEFSLPAERIATLQNRCVFHYSPAVSPDYYGWVFPKGDRVSVGVGTRLENRDAIDDLLLHMKSLHSDLLRDGKLIKRNGGMIPRAQYRQYGRGRMLLCGDAAGLVLPACGEGIYFAMRSGEIAGEVIREIGDERPDIVASRYTDLVKAEFSPIFRYFAKVERLAFKSAISREVFVRLAQDRFMAQKILRAFASKRRQRTPVPKKLAVALKLLGIRLEVALSVSRRPGFGE